MNKHEEKELIEMARYVFASNTEYAKELRRLVSFYHDNQDNAPPLPEPTKKDNVVVRVSGQAGPPLEEMRELKKVVRHLYEERTGQKWRPQLRVIQGGEGIERK